MATPIFGRGGRPREGGAAAIEAAVCIPLLVVFACAALDIGRAATACMELDCAAHAAARQAAMTAVADSDSWRAGATAAAAAAAPQLSADDIEVSFELTEKSETAYTHRLPSTTGNGFEPRESAAASREVSAEVSSRVAAITPIGKEIFKACWQSEAPRLSCKAVERVDATVEEGESSW